MFGLFNKAPPEGDLALVKQALGPDVAVLVSASCCTQGTADIDARAEEAVRKALDDAGLDWPVLNLTLTQAQRALGALEGRLDPAEARLAGQVSELFMSHGLTAFPVVMVSQRLVSFGGAPDVALVRTALDTLPSHESAA